MLLLKILDQERTGSNGVKCLQLRRHHVHKPNFWIRCIDEMYGTVCAVERQREEQYGLYVALGRDGRAVGVAEYYRARYHDP